ncbi:hypothetical protein I6N91_03180 [Arthrobacter sp. MSA 4-2]|uniref:hypothetical protein n=1 Tax=Arthrobacter sp. MSA 4-2 TaxID=2794349 RepID=UPI0018E82888|nr:hypothetical protein [Arthrobacter sp. MSA 4-2]MBJ2119977.1 hypothetical protein [Arthrobacter sp. MSA 4-2]
MRSSPFLTFYGTKHSAKHLPYLSFLFAKTAAYGVASLLVLARRIDGKLDLILTKLEGK